VLGPTAWLLRRIATDFDSYVPDRLAEIERLAVLATAASAIAETDDAGGLNGLLDAARKASGHLPASQLDDLTDALHRELVAVQERIELATDQPSVTLAAGIWAEQTRAIKGCGA
jgi:hypothetical protein